MESRCKKEVVDLHEFFMSWFKGEDVALSRFEQALAPDFQIVPPSGTLVSRPDLLKSMAAAKARFAETHFKIWIEAVRVRPVGRDLFLVTYEEWQTIGRETKGRLSTALLAPEKDAPNGLIWHHVHETWLPLLEGDQ